MSYKIYASEAYVNENINELKKNGQVGYTEPLTARLDIPKDGKLTADVNLMGIEFMWFSSITPTKEQFLEGKHTTVHSGGSYTLPMDDINTTIVAEATGAYCVRAYGCMYVVSTVTENELGTLPKTGMYISLNSFGVSASDFTIIFDFGEITHTIDPKYLPNPYLDLTPYIGNVANFESIPETEIDFEEAKAIMSKIKSGEIRGILRIANVGEQKVSCWNVFNCVLEQDSLLQCPYTLGNGTVQVFAIVTDGDKGILGTMAENTESTT